jgi:hypothetical protein
VNPKKIKSGPAAQWMKGKDFRLAKEKIHSASGG